MIWVNTTAMTKDEIVEKLQGMDVLTDGVEEPWSAENFLRCLGEVGGPSGGYHAMTTAEWENYSHQEGACCDREIVAKNLAIAALDDAGIDTTDIEIRTSEFTTGEIRVYGWPETMANTICRKLGISANELNSLFTGCPVDGAVGTSVARELRERFELNEDEEDLAAALQEKGILTQEEAAWLREDC